MANDPSVTDLLANLPSTLDDEQFTQLLDRPGVRIERIVSTGHVTADGEWYDQDDDEWVVVLTGAARLVFLEPEVSVDLSPGQAVFIEAHRRHRVAWTSTSEPTVWLAVHVSR